MTERAASILLYTVHDPCGIYFDLSVGGIAHKPDANVGN